MSLLEKFLFVSFILALGIAASQAQGLYTDLLDVFGRADVMKSRIYWLF